MRIMISAAALLCIAATTPASVMAGSSHMAVGDCQGGWLVMYDWPHTVSDKKWGGLNSSGEGMRAVTVGVHYHEVLPLNAWVTINGKGPFRVNDTISDKRPSMAVLRIPAPYDGENLYGAKICRTE